MAVIPRKRSSPSTVIFDLGGVLIDWDPRRPYRDLLASDDEIERFFDRAGMLAWNAQQDAGLAWDVAIEEHAAKHPEYANLIAAWHARWTDMLVGPIDGTVSILKELRSAGTPTYALTNWSDSTFPIARERYGFLDWFDGIVVSGEERVIKPDPRIYQILFERYDVDPADAVFIDDSPRNVKAAVALGVTALHFTDSHQLRAQLAELGLVAATP